MGMPRGIKVPEVELKLLFQGTSPRYESSRQLAVD